MVYVLTTATALGIFQVRIQEYTVVFVVIVSEMDGNVDNYSRTASEINRKDLSNKLIFQKDLNR